MYYCFLKQDYQILDNRDPLHLQIEYSKVIKKFCLLDLCTGVVWNQENRIIDLSGKRVLLRSSYDNMMKGLQILQNQNAILVEKYEDIEKIETWPNLECVKREIFVIKISDIIQGNLNKKIGLFLQTQEQVFLKSIKKGFSLITSAEKVLSRDNYLLKFLKEKSSEFGDAILLSKGYSIKKDSLGNRESRHIVLNGRIINSSRYVYSVKHIVTKSHLRFANDIVEYLSKIKYPLNYVLDVGEFGDKGFFDIVEINPLSSAMCYVNNSVFTVSIPEIEILHKYNHYGFEYCLDYLKHPDYYRTIRTSNGRYEYTNETHYVI